MRRDDVVEVGKWRSHQSPCPIYPPPFIQHSSYSTICSDHSSTPHDPHAMDWGNHVSVVEHREPSQEWAHFDRTILQANPGSSFTLVFPLADNVSWTCSQRLIRVAGAPGSQKTRIWTRTVSV